MIQFQRASVYNCEQLRDGASHSLTWHVRTYLEASSLIHRYLQENDGYLHRNVGQSVPFAWQKLQVLVGIVASAKTYPSYIGHVSRLQLSVLLVSQHRFLAADGWG